MIKVEDKRYNPADFRKYYPIVNPHGEHCIVIEWIFQNNDSIICFNDQKSRDDTLNAWDEALLLVNDGKVVMREMDVPFLLGGGGQFSPPGGIDLH
jgi:hypothetical protein